MVSINVKTLRKNTTYGISTGVLCTVGGALVRNFTVFWTFLALCAAIAVKLCTWFYINDLQIKFKDGSLSTNFWKSYAPLNLAIFRNS
jgi:hypothetical protein